MPPSFLAPFTVTDPQKPLFVRQKLNSADCIIVFGIVRHGYRKKDAEN